MSLPANTRPWKAWPAHWIAGRASAAPGLRSASRDDRTGTETRVHEHLVVIDSNAACRQSLPDCALLTLCDPFELVHCLC